MDMSSRFIHVKLLKLLIFIAPFCLSLSLAAQRLPQNQPKFDRQPVHFGFSIGLNYMDFNIQEIENLAALPGYYSVQSTQSPGYTIRIISSLRLSDYWDLRFTPGFAATERTLTFDVVEQFTDRRNQSLQRKIESSYVEMPLTLKWKSERIDNYRLYVQGGGKYNLDLASKQDVEDDRIFKVKRNDFFYEFGFGVDIYFEFFKFSPEIIASWGVTDLNVQDGTFLVEGIHRLESRAILINFTFE